MSFVKALATLAAGFAAARGVDAVRRMGGIDAVQDRLRQAGSDGGMATPLGQMAERMGLPGGAKAVQDMAATWGPRAADMTEAAEAGFRSIMGAISGAMAAGTDAMGKMMAGLPGGAAATAVSEEQARLVIRAMIEAAKADGRVDPDERDRIMAAIADQTPEVRDYVAGLLDAPSDPVGLAKAAAGGMGAQVYTAALATVKGDSAAEQSWLRNLAQGLGLSDDERARIHAGMGLPVA